MTQPLVLFYFISSFLSSQDMLFESNESRKLRYSDLTFSLLMWESLEIRGPFDQKEVFGRVSAISKRRGQIGHHSSLCHPSFFLLNVYASFISSLNLVNIH